LAARAQQLQRVHVRSFTLSASTARPRLEEPFDVTLTIAVTQRLATLENVYLPSFMGAEELGDVRAVSQNANGTIYRETLRLVPHASGDLTISRAYFDAVDARDGKPKRFMSNALTLRVAGPSPQFPWRSALSIAMWVLAGVLAAVIVRYRRTLRNRRGALRPAQGGSIPHHDNVIPHHDIEIPHDDPKAQALANLKIRRDRASVLALRDIVWREAGAVRGETLRDVLRRPQAADGEMRRMLVAVERAAFTDDERLPQAIDDIVRL
jgi:hypothetical protein